jgi:hypothetical protein
MATVVDKLAMETAGKEALAMRSFAEVRYQSRFRPVLCSRDYRLVCHHGFVSPWVLMQALRQMPGIIADNAGQFPAWLTLELLPPGGVLTCL